MPIKIITLSIPTHNVNAYPITELVQEALESTGMQMGTVSLFCKHTSCSLMIMEESDPAAWRDLIEYMNRLVPQNFPGFTHRVEGPDDMPSHIKMALTRTSEVVPFNKGKLLLGTWQGIFLWEHRTQSYRREVVLTFNGE